MGAAGAGGSDKSDEKKVDTYADQYKKIEARKSKTKKNKFGYTCLLYTSPSPRDGLLSRMPSSA